MSARDRGPALVVYYDGACPVCRTEIGVLSGRDRGCGLAPVDIAAPGFDAAAHGFDARALDAEMHAVRADGSVVRGMDAIRAAYGAAGLGAWLAPTGWPVLRPVFDAAYRLFARHRRAISGALAPLLGRRGRPAAPRTDGGAR